MISSPNLGAGDPGRTKAVAERILNQVNTLPEGALISAKEFLHLGSRAAVDQALKRLQEKKQLMRITRGVHVRPVETRFGMRAPAPEKVVANLATSHAETVVSHGAAAANALGLTTQVPTKLVYLTSGRSRRLNLGTQVVEMKHAPQWMLLPSHRAAGEAVRALECTGVDATAILDGAVHVYCLKPDAQRHRSRSVSAPRRAISRTATRATGMTSYGWTMRATPKPPSMTGILPTRSLPTSRSSSVQRTAKAIRLIMRKRSRAD
ncbi:DUF6088 family protein [Bradyrhizobium nanningense]|uniref:DUF6088 family protein n=1 Tax=Bradyrhizobium nanningense TaxID=1325118 RepID=UPI003221CABC